MNFLKQFFSIPLGLILLLNIVVYFPTVSYDFVWDDVVFIKQWPEIRSAQHVDALLKGNLPSSIRPNTYRPVRSMLYVLSYQLWGENPTGYHFQGILIHCLGIIVVYHLIFELIHKKTETFFATLLFGIHPLQVEATTFITSSFDTVGLILVMASILAYIKKHNRVSLLLAWLATFISELTFVMPLLTLSYEFVYNPNINFKKKISKVVPYVIPIVTYFLLRLTIPLPFLQASQSTIISRFSQATTLLVHYIYLMIYPTNLTVNHPLWLSVTTLTPFDQLMQRKTIISPPTINIFLSLIAIGGGLKITSLYWRTKPVLSYALLLMVIPLLPVLQFIPQATIFCERYAYLSLLGFSLLIVILTNKKALLLGYAAFLLTQTFWTIPHWQNNFTLWKHAYSLTPNSPSVLINLGNEAITLKKNSEAIHYLQRAIALNPNIPVTYNSLGIAYSNDGQIELSENIYKIAITRFPNFIPPYTNLAILYYQTQRFNEAVAIVHQSPTAVDPSLNFLYDK